MVDNLYTFDQIRAALPDNVSNLISPENVRSSALSVSTDAGEVGDGSSWTIALAAGVPSNINSQLPAPNSEILRGWAVDGNAALVSDLAAEFTIAPGHLRGINITAIIIGQNDGTADDTFTWEILRGAVVVASVVTFLEGGVNAEDLSIGVTGLESYEPGLQEPWSVQVTSANGEDFAFADFDLKAWGMPI